MYFFRIETYPDYSMLLTTVILLIAVTMKTATTRRVKFARQKTGPHIGPQLRLSRYPSGFT